MYHYVYRITNKKEKIHYYGSRTSNIEPKKDLGILYFSSSKILKQKIKEQPIENFKFKVIKLFESRSEAFAFEHLLHKKFEVCTNDNFYNKSIQTTSKFSWFGQKHTEEAKKNMSITRKGRIPWNVGIKFTDIYTKEERQKKFTSKCSGWDKINNEYWTIEENRERRKKFLNSMSSKGEKNPFYGKSHTEETKKYLSFLRSQAILVTFTDGHQMKFNQYGELGTYLGKSVHLGSKLCKPQFFYLWEKYNIKDIEKI